MEEMREGIPEKSNHEVMKEEESLTSSWRGGVRAETKRDWVAPEWHSLLEYAWWRGRAKRQLEKLTGTREGRVFLRSQGFGLKLCKGWCDADTCSFWMIPEC